MTPEEYLRLERRAERRSEYYDGKVVAMSGSSLRHGLIVTNLIGALSQQLKPGPCRVYSTNVRLKVQAAGFYAYPDVMVVCGDAQLADDDADTILNPIVIIEVLTDETQEYGRGRKFERYRKLPSLIEYLPVADNGPHVEHWRRQSESTWLISDHDDLAQTIRLHRLRAGAF